MYVADNYGARWVKGMLNWIRLKTLKGYPYQFLIKDAMMECGLKKAKTIELVNEWAEMGLLVNESGFIRWVDANIKVNPNNQGTPQENIDEKIQPYLEAKKNLETEKEEALPDEQVKEMLREKFKNE